jgi:hypothetical protein
MTAVTPLPGTLQWLGLAKEVTPGTAVAAPTMWIPVDSPKLSPKVTVLSDNNLRGVMATDFGSTQGMSYTELGYKTSIYADTIFPHLMAMLGGADVMTGAADPYTHKTSLLNTSDATHSAQPPTYTGFLYQGDGKVAQVAGMTASDLKFGFKANERNTVDVSWVGMPVQFIAAPANTPSTVAEMPPFTAAISIGGTAFPSSTGISIDIKRDVKPIAVLNGSQNPLTIYAGPVSVSGSIDAVYKGSADSLLTGLLTNGQPAVTVSVNGQNDATHPLTLQMSKVRYDSADPAGSTTDWMTIAAAFTALANPTDALDGKLSPIQATLANAQSTAY